jgi:hypothetical protein
MPLKINTNRVNRFNFACVESVLQLLMQHVMLCSPAKVHQGKAATVRDIFPQEGHAYLPT